MEFWDGSGISWTICKQSAPHSRQITASTHHCSIFRGQMLFLTPNQQCQSTEGTYTYVHFFTYADTQRQRTVGSRVRVEKV